MNEDYDDPIDALAELFAEVDPEPDQRFLDNLESRLRVAHAEQNRAPASVSPRWGRVAGLVTVAVVVLAAATAGLVYRDRSVSSALEMSDASGVSLTLPDGSTIEDPPDGFELANGTVIVIKVGGSAVIDDVTLDEGAVVTVRDGSLVTDAPVDLAAPPASPATTRPASTAPSDVSDLPGPTTDVGSPPPVDVTTPTDPADTPTRPEPGGQQTRPPKPSPPGRPIDPPVTIEPGPIGPPITIEPGPIGPPIPIVPGPIGPPVSAPSTTIAPPVVDTAPGPAETVPVGLRVKRHGRTHEVKIAWSSGSAPATDWRVIVIRSTADSPPEWPAAGATVVVGESPSGVTGSAVDNVPPDAAVARYRVVLVGRSGAVVAASVVQTVNLA